MNIFVLDVQLRISVQYHCNKHVVKMPLEAAQIGSTVVGGPYKPTHANHPCTVWARESRSNLVYVLAYGYELCVEYTHRYGKRHKCEEVLRECYDLRHRIPDIGQTPHPQCMPEQYKRPDVVDAYRAYYIGEKHDILQYTNRDTPSWLYEEVI